MIDTFRRRLNYIKDNCRYLQYIVAVCVGVLELSVNTHLVWISPTLPCLLSNDSPIGRPLTDEESSWVIVSMNIGALCGCVLLALLFDILGRKPILLLGAVLVFSSWILIGVATSVGVLAFGRVVGGLGQGISIPCLNVYICEVSSKEIRGKLGAIPVVVSVFGNVFVLTAGPYLSYTILIICCAIFPVVFIVLFSFMPESPYHLIKINKERDAERSLQRLSKHTVCHSEIEAMLQEIVETAKRDECSQTLLQLLRLKTFRKSLLIVAIADSVRIFSGMNFIGSYLQVIIGTSNMGLSHELFSVIYGLVQIPSVLLSGVLVDKFGRKPLFCISSLGAGVALIVEGIYLYLQMTVDLSAVSSLPILCLTLFKIFVSFGIFYMPQLFGGELFSISSKKMGNLISMCYYYTLSFVYMKVFGTLSTVWGMYTIFWISAGACFLGVPFSLYILLETKGKSLEEIQNDLSSTGNGSL
ncbi:facilitated trehalose transporter Tret1-like [Photinus pyralis]|uniref:facilitated trehalose transporter Tret1-like n=1 Tax=Photinus pyralis TaxID=7054 RepID=UPI0012673066|nr:facilitated trehalose transporter Tret1-like [Photinus pyralis]